MPVAKNSTTDPEPADTPATDSAEPRTAAPATPAARAVPAAAEPDPDAGGVPEGRLPAGTYEYVWTVPTLYLEVPLTAYPASPAVPATDDTPEIPAQPATVFDWPFSAPGDGRWQPSKKQPNSQPDNTPANPEE